MDKKRSVGNQDFPNSEVKNQESLSQPSCMDDGDNVSQKSRYLNASKGNWGNPVKKCTNNSGT